LSQDISRTYRRSPVEDAPSYRRLDELREVALPESKPGELRPHRARKLRTTMSVSFDADTVQRVVVSVDMWFSRQADIPFGV
jgi:hypothetical protein